jgi:hypothetical protein
MAELGTTGKYDFKKVTRIALTKDGPDDTHGYRLDFDCGSDMVGAVIQLTENEVIDLKVLFTNLELDKDKKDDAVVVTELIND